MNWNSTHYTLNRNMNWNRNSTHYTTLDTLYTLYPILNPNPTPNPTLYSLQSLHRSSIRMNKTAFNNHVSTVPPSIVQYRGIVQYISQYLIYYKNTHTNTHTHNNGLGIL